MNRRKHARFTVDYPCQYFGEHFAGEGRLQDLSKEGARLCSDTPASRGDYLKMVVALPNCGRLLRIDLATTRWARASEFGVEFIQMDRQQQQLLHDCLQGLTLMLTQAYAMPAGLAMTGTVTSEGDMGPTGGLFVKLVAAERVRMRTVLISSASPGASDSPAVLTCLNRSSELGRGSLSTHDELYPDFPSVDLLACR
ncbi:MAG: PilZ domain-containing protein [Nitrospiraceae bacterium]